LLAGLVEFRNAVQAGFGVELPATVTFDYPTPAALAGFIASRVAPAQQQQEFGAAGAASLVPAAQRLPAQQGSTTEIVGWAASVASSGDPDTSEPFACPLDCGVGKPLPPPYQRVDACLL
jgi:hypothetical protein